MNFELGKCYVPTFLGDTITAKARVAEEIEGKRWVRMALI